MMKKISAVISAYNEEKKIKNCLESITWADEIVVVDNSSTDSTGEIAKKMGAVVVTQPNDPLLIDLQKNTGIKKAKNDWVLLVDADEVVTDELRVEIKSLLEKDDLKNGYFIPRKNIIFGREMEHSGWYPDHQLRLFRKDKAEFKSGNVHEHVSVDGEVGYLNEHIKHQNYESIDQFVQRNMMVYARIQAESLMKDDYILKPSDLLELPAKEFFSRYFSRKGYRDGLHGLFLSLLMAASTLVVLAYVWEKKGFERIGEKEVSKYLGSSLENIYKDAKYWVLTSKIDESRNPVEKTGYKIKRKLR
jgi:glycosyltransferase involved in cell wall biosynthesis